LYRSVEVNAEPKVAIERAMSPWMVWRAASLTTLEDGGLERRFPLHPTGVKRIGWVPFLGNDTQVRLRRVEQSLFGAGTWLQRHDRCFGAETAALPSEPFDDAGSADGSFAGWRRWLLLGTKDAHWEMLLILHRSIQRGYASFPCREKRRRSAGLSHMLSLADRESVLPRPKGVAADGPQPRRLLYDKVGGAGPRYGCRDRRENVASEGQLGDERPSESDA